MVGRASVPATRKPLKMVAKISKSSVFQCRQCGDCCAGRGGIMVKPGEVKAMAALLALPEAEFCRRFVEASALGPLLTVADGVCVFLMPGGLCRVHRGEALYLPPVAFSPGHPHGPGRTGQRQNRLPGPQPGL